MSAAAITPPFPIFTDLDGQPLEAGYIWIGVENLPPQTNPTTVYWDEAFTQPAAQPIRTSGGYPVNNGTPAALYAPGAYSILVQDSRGTLMYSALSETTLTSSADVTFLQAGTGAVTRTGQSKMRDFVSVKDFGAVGNGVTDDTAAITQAFNTLYTTTNGGGVLYFPKGVYLVTSLSFNCANFSFQIIGEGLDCSVIRKTGAAASPVLHLYSANTNKQVLIRDLEIDGNNVAGCDALYLDAMSLVTVRNVRAWKARYAVYGKGCLVSKFEMFEGRNSTNGFIFRYDAGLTLYANHITLDNCRAVGNTSWGVDYGEGSGLYLNECDIETNGTAANISTGGVLIRNSIDDESGYGQVTLTNCWLENNAGWSIFVQGASGGNVEIQSTQIINAESGRSIRAEAGLRRLGLSSVTAASVGDTVEVNAENLFAANCLINTLTNNATNYSIHNVKTATQDSLTTLKTASGGSDINIGTAVVTSKTTPKVLCQFDGTAASPITPSFQHNVTDITKNATGDYTVNFTNAVSSGAIIITALSVGGEAFAARYVSGSTTNIRFLVVDSAGAGANAAVTSVAIWGT